MVKKNGTTEKSDTPAQDWRFSLTFDERFRMFSLISLARPESIPENRRITQALSALEGKDAFDPPAFAEEEEVKEWEEQYRPLRASKERVWCVLSLTHVETLLSCVKAVFGYKGITSSAMMMQSTRFLDRFMRLLERASDKQTVEGEAEPVVRLVPAPAPAEEESAEPGEVAAE